MRTVMLSQLAIWCEGRLIGEDVAIENISTDSRKKLDGALFVALRGERFDAHEFVSQAEENGAAALLLQRPGQDPFAAYSLSGYRRGPG